MTATDFHQFVSLRTGALLRMAYLLTGDAHTAEDLVQESLLRCHRRWEKVAQAASPEAYVRRVVVNQHLSWRRRRSASEVVVEPGSIRQAPAPDVQEALATRDQLWGLLGELPARQRTVLVLRYYEDLSDADISELLGCRVGTVRSLAARAFARLRDHPELAGYAVPATVLSEGGS
jgi:RNA polymerase sigma-70 factor (sigma-E family)